MITRGRPAPAAAAGTDWARRIPRTPAAERLDLHNVGVHTDVATHGLCGNLHLATGRTCRRPARHPGACEFTSAVG